MFYNYLLLLVLSLASSIVSANGALTRIGYAYDKKSNELVYTENHFENYIDGLVHSSRVVYKDPSENIIGTKTVDFSNNEFIPEFNLKNQRNGHKEATRFVQSEYEITFSKKENSPEEQKKLELPEDGISDAGFDNFIIKHWKELSDGQAFKRNFLIPSMMDFIKFRIYQSDIINDEGLSFRVINIEPDNFLIRAFAGTTKLFYDKNKPLLVKFDGVSNMRDDKGNNYKVTIRYEQIKNLASRKY